MKLKLLFLILAGIGILVFLLVGCNSFVKYPKQYDGQPQICYEFERCMYLNKNNPDKSICNPYAQECRAQRRYIYCSKKENRWETDSSQNCWDKLNSK